MSEGKITGSTTVDVPVNVKELRIDPPCADDHVRLLFSPDGAVQADYIQGGCVITICRSEAPGGIVGEISFAVPLRASWKVPFRQYYAGTFMGMLRGCWVCFWATVRHRLAGSPSLPGGPQ